MNKLQKTEKFNKKENKLTYKKIEFQLDHLVKGQEINREELRMGFHQLADQNRFLSLQNQQLLDLKQQLKTVVEELNQIKKERQKKAARKELWANRKRLPKRDPVTPEIYNLLIKESEGPSYIATRTRIAICLLTVTGIRIGKLLSLKVGQLETLVKESWISIDRLKRGSANHKAFLTGKTIKDDCLILNRIMGLLNLSSRQ